MIHAARSGQRRSGFTLVEMMVVIAIIGVLVALLVTAVAKALATANRTKNRHEISQLETALEQFKAKYGMYPPSRILLCETTGGYADMTPPGVTARYASHPILGPLAQQSSTWLQTIWPRISSAYLVGRASPAGAVLGVDWNGNRRIDPPAGTPHTPAPPGDYILEGDQCLVFFLGGIPDNTPDLTTNALYPLKPGSCTGFAKDPTNPAAHIELVFPTPLPATSSANSPLYEFSSDRLFVMYNFLLSPPPPVPFRPNLQVLPYLNTSNVQRSSLHYSCKDAYRTRPYAYFCAANGRNSYINIFCVTQADSDCRSLLISPNEQLPNAGTMATDLQSTISARWHAYPYIEVSTAAVPKKYWKAETFQLISAGSDEKFGPGTTVDMTNPTQNFPVMPITSMSRWGVNLMPWTPANASQIYPSTSVGADDQANFTASALGVGVD